MVFETIKNQNNMFHNCVLLLGYIEEACIIPCPSDCKLSEWSNWSRCSKSCGSGVKVRSKWLREKPYNGGRPCPKLDHINQVQALKLELFVFCSISIHSTSVIQIICRWRKNELLMNNKLLCAELSFTFYSLLLR